MSKASLLGRLPDPLDAVTAAVLGMTRPISAGDALKLVTGKTEKPGGVDPAVWLKGDTGIWRLGDVPLDLFVDNESGDRYDGTVCPVRLADYAARAPVGVPPVVATQGRHGTGKLRIIDGGHRISSARLRGDTTISTLVRVKDSRSLMSA